MPLAGKIGPFPDVFGACRATPWLRMHVENETSAARYVALPRGPGDFGAKKIVGESGLVGGWGLWV